jgi:hypothetical protein
MDPLMRQSFKRVSRAAIVAAAGALAACTSSLPDFSQFKLPTARALMPANVDTYVPPVSTRAIKPIGPSDLVDAQGMCAALAPPAAAPQANQASDSAAPAPAPAVAPPAVLGPVGLDMSECEVVAAIGPPQSVNIGSSERGARKVTMVYMASERAGTYEFIDGRLKSLERGPEPPPAPKPEKKKKPATAKKPVPKQPAT